MATIIDGKKVSASVRQRISEERAEFEKKTGITPGLAVIIVGEDPASQIYVRNKGKACEEVGFYSEIHRLPEETTEEELLSLVKSLNENEKIHGILVQSPLPKHLDEALVVNNIDYRKDVDAFHPVNVGKIMIGDYSFLPCTPAGVMELLKAYDIDVCGKECVVIGRSNIVGKPMAMLLLKENATVTVCHTKTKNLKEICREAEILVAAAGVAKMLNQDYVADGAVVIDVGINVHEDGQLCGDVEWEGLETVASAATPVPGGVGAVTTTMLCRHLAEAAMRKLQK